MRTTTLLFSATLAMSAAAQTTYTIAEIVPPAGMLADCRDVDASGRVVGRIYEPASSSQSRAFVWHRGNLRVLPSPGGARRVEATALDRAGRIYGTVFGQVNRSTVYSPVLWYDDRVLVAPTLFENVYETVVPSPSAMFLVSNTLPFDNPTPGWKNQFGWPNEPDFTLNSGDRPLPVVYDMRGPGPRIAGTYAAAWSQALTDVNDSGQAVGYVDYGGLNRRHAIRWDAHQGAIQLGAGGRRGSIAVAINDGGTIVGYVTKTDSGNVNSDSRQRPFVWRDAVFTELPIPAGFEHGRADDINDRGVVVGTLGSSVVQPWQTDGAWIYRGGALLDLNSLVPAGAGWDFDKAVRINNRGQILAAVHVGPGFLDYRYALLTPRD